MVTLKLLDTTARLPEVARQRISGQLVQGVTFEGILDDIIGTVLAASLIESIWLQGRTLQT